MTQEEFENFNNFINELLYDKMEIEDYYYIMDKLGAIQKGNRFTSICHNSETGKYNLSFLEESRTFYCFSECSCSYSILSLIKKVKGLKTYKALAWLCEELNIPFNFKEEIQKPQTDIYNWKKGLNKYLKGEKQVKILPKYDKLILNYFPKIVYKEWADYGITEETMDKYNIRYYPYKNQIIIPCYEQCGDMCGIRIRNTNEEMIENIGIPKYMPLEMLNGFQYKFPTNLCFYGENFNWTNCKRTKSVILAEGEKSVLKHDSWFGSENNICLGMFGSTLGSEQLKKLVEWGVETYYISLDSDFESIYNSDKTELTEDYIKFEDKVKKLIKEIRPYAKDIYVIYNNIGLKNFYKCNMYDGSIEQFNLLWNNKELIE